MASPETVRLAGSPYQRAAICVLPSKNTSIIEVLRRPVESAQYTSQEFIDFTDNLGIRRSLGRTGTRYDNAWAESFSGTLKNERITGPCTPPGNTHALTSAPTSNYYYNDKRLHSTLGFITSNEAQQNWFRQRQAV